MEDITFKILKDNELVSVDSSEIFLNKRVLLCSITAPHQIGPVHYLKHLEECQKKYKKYGIDNVYITNASHLFDNKWLIAYVNSFFPELIPIVDYEGKFNNYLKKNLNLYKEYNQYQILINNGEIENVYTTEEEDFVGYTEYFKLLTYIEKNIEKISKIEIKKYKSKKQDILTLGANMLISSLKNKNKTRTDADLQIVIAKAFFYNSLWPNTKLEKYLGIKE